MTVIILGYKDVNKRSLAGYINIYLPKTGLEIFGLTHHKTDDGREWVNLPSKEYTTPEGEKKYLSIVRYRERSHSDAFGRAVLAALKEFDRPKAPPVQEKLFQEDEKVPF